MSPMSQYPSSKLGFLIDTDARPIRASKIAREAVASGVHSLPLLADVLRARGLDWVVCNLTTRDLEMCGVYVAKVVVPGMLPVSGGRAPRYMFRNLDRVRSVAKHYGIGNVSLDSINLDTQPFL